MNHMKTAKEFLHSNEINEWDSVFDPGGKQEYTEEQLIRFAEIWEEKCEDRFKRIDVKSLVLIRKKVNKLRKSNILLSLAVIQLK